MNITRRLIYLFCFVCAVLSGLFGLALVIYSSWADFLGTGQTHLQQTNETFFQYGAFVICALAILITFLLRIPSTTSRTHGSAHFATISDVQKAGLLAPSRRAPETPRPSFLEIGNYHGRIVGLTEQKQESHVLLVAPTGKRKTSGIIVPGLLQEYGNRSLLINDIKGELYRLTAGALAQYMKVHVFRPTQPEQSICYNPLAFVRSMEDAEDLAMCFIQNTGKSKEPFWDAAAKLLLVATILHIREEEPDAPFCRIADILAGSELAEIKTMLSESLSQLARDAATTFIQSISMNERLAGSIMTDMAVRLLVLKNPDIRKVTAKNELSFDVSSPSALFLSIPMSNAERLKWLSSCLIMQMMKSFVHQAETTPSQRLVRGFAFYLDEFANIGVIPHYTEYISLVRSLGISFIMAIQNFGQLIGVYEEYGKDIILANSNTEIVYPGCGLVETQYYSDKAGVTTQDTTSKSGSIPRFKWQPYTSESKSETQRRLLTADEIRTLSLGTLLVLTDNVHPFLVTNKTYLARTDLQARIIPFSIPPRDLPTPPSYIIKVAPEEQDYFFFEDNKNNTDHDTKTI